MCWLGLTFNTAITIENSDKKTSDMKTKPKIVLITLNMVKESMNNEFRDIFIWTVH